MSHDPIAVLDWLYDHNRLRGSAVYDGCDRYRDAYLGSSHKARMSRSRGYLYNVDRDVRPDGRPAAADGLLLVTGDLRPLTDSEKTQLAEAARASSCTQTGAGVYRINF